MKSQMLYPIRPMLASNLTRCVYYTQRRTEGPYGLLEFDGLQEELKAELGELEQEDLNERLLGADHVPVHTPAGPSRVEARPAAAQESEDAELEALQAALAMS